MVLVVLVLPGCRKSSSILESIDKSVPGQLSIDVKPDTSYAEVSYSTRFNVVRYGPDTTALAYTWQFNDGSVPVTVLTGTISHIFQQAGTYNVVCKVSHIGSPVVLAVDSSVACVISYGSAHIYFDPSAVNATLDEPVVLEIKRQGDITAPLEYVWDFGDGTPRITTSTVSMSHAFSITGVFTATCRAVLKNTTIIVDSAECSVSVAPYDFTSIPKMWIEIRLPGMVHDSMKYYYDERIYDTVHDTTVFIWGFWDFNRDTISVLKWNGDSFSCSSSNSWPMHKLSLSGVLSGDHKYIRSMHCTWSWAIGGNSRFTRRYSFDLLDIPIDPPASSTERTCHMKGNNLTGHLIKADFTQSDDEVQSRIRKITLISWYLDDRASLSIWFTK
jgi:hypothetical protein